MLSVFDDVIGLDGLKHFDDDFYEKVTRVSKARQRRVGTVDVDSSVNFFFVPCRFIFAARGWELCKKEIRSTMEDSEQRKTERNTQKFKQSEEL